MLGDIRDWGGVHTAVGAGPRLVADGESALDAAAEGFQAIRRFLTGGGARGGIAIRKDGSILIGTVPGATMKQWARVMMKLGAQPSDESGRRRIFRTLLFQGRTVTAAGPRTK